MSRLIDPTICPDCRAALDDAATCTGCGLRITGPLAGQLWSAMQGADRLVEQLRGAVAPLPPPVPAGAPSVAPPPLATPPAPARRRLPAASVPVVLLSLGALCLMVAAIVFVAVTWSLLGLAGRTLVLLTLTGLLAGAATLLSRRSLRGAAETFWLVVAGMLAVDLLAAQSAGLGGLDALGWRGTGALVGGALALLGTGVALWARTLPLGRLYGMQLVAGLGGLVVTTIDVWFAEDTALACTLAVPVLVGIAQLLRRGLPAVAVTALALGGVTWLVLLAAGLARAADATSAADWWSTLTGWPLLVAAAYAGAGVLVTQVPDAARVVLAGLALAPLAALLNAPFGTGTPTEHVVLATGTLAVLAAVTRFAPLVWARGAGVLTAAGVVGLGGLLVLAPWGTLGRLDLDGRSAVGVTLPSTGVDVDAWAFGLVALGLVVAGGGLLRLVDDRPDVVRVLAPAAILAAGLGALDLVLRLDPPLVTGVLVASLGALLATGTAWALRAHAAAARAGVLASAYLLLLTLLLAGASHVLSATVASGALVVLLAAMALREREGADVPAGVLAAAGVLAGGYAMAQWGFVLEADATARALAVAAYAVVALLAAAPVTRRSPARAGLEAGALVVGVASLVLSPAGAPSAVVLTVLGSGVALASVLFLDRLDLGWLGSVLLALATFVRFDAGVAAPELYTLPAAALLVVAGAWRLRTSPEPGSLRLLGSGLSLALLPSLLLALDEPVSLRGALVGLGGVLVLAAGLQQRLAAPFVLGALTTAVLALRHLEPWAQAVPRWISLGLLGAALLAVGVTWEARVRNVRSAREHLGALR